MSIEIQDVNALTDVRKQVYFKNDEMREMDDHFGDLYGMISEREIEISHELAQYVLGFEKEIIHASDILGELDRCVANTIAMLHFSNLDLRQS